MNVHVVAPSGGQGNQVLDRLAQRIAAGNGWALSAVPDQRAEVNLFFPYLLHESCGTQTAAWFSHYDEAMPGKTQRWEHVASCVDLRLTCAPRYAEDLSRYGPAILVPPAVDLDVFHPGPSPEHSRPRVGVSGMVYPSGRKGEALVARLVASKPAYDLVATGSGWPCKVEVTRWQDVPAFYRSLDVYLCTSLVEGIPMPPLEALATGLPVVVPRGVGMLDLLGDREGIHRYDAGDYDGVVAAVDSALADTTSPGARRAAVEGYTWERCCIAYRDAIRGTFFPHTVSLRRVLPSLDKDRGFFVVAYGKQARKCAERCIRSIHLFMPGYPVCLAAETPGLGEDVFVYHPEDDIGARAIKTKIYDLAPATWQYVVYLDADTELIASVPFLFQVVEDGWDLAICYNPAQYHLAAQMRRPDNGEELSATFRVMGGDEFLQYNGGVFALRRSERMAAFMRGWHSEWQRWGKRDQAALDRVLYREPVRIWTLGSEWNTVTRYIDPSRSAGILHYPTEARRWSGILHERTAASQLRDGGVL